MVELEVVLKLGRGQALPLNMLMSSDPEQRRQSSCVPAADDRPGMAEEEQSWSTMRRYAFDFGAFTLNRPHCLDFLV